MEVKAKPVKDRRLLEMVFRFPDLRPHYRSRPSHMISHILGYEGAGSLLSYLKSTKHWVDSLGVGPTHINAGTELFKISMSLTKEGLGSALQSGIDSHVSTLPGSRRNCVSIHRPAQTTYCLNPLKLTFLEPVSTFEIIWEELKAMDEAHFRFAEKDQPSEFTSSTATSMQRCYPPDWVLSAPHLLREVCSRCL